MKKMLLPQNLLFLSLLFLSIIIALSSNSLLSLWLSLEINLMSVMPIFLTKEKKNTEQSMMMYFLIQGISSSIMLNCFLTICIFYFMKSFLMFLICLTMFMKLGVFPFYMWVPNIMEGLSWESCFILSTMQKIIPITLMSFLGSKMWLFFMIIINFFVGSAHAISQFSFRKVFSFSSMNHLSFMLINLMISKKIFKIYFMIYMYSSLILFFLFNFMNMNYISSLFKKKTKTLEMNLLIVFLSFMGTPPMLGFIPKFLTFLKMMELKMIIFSICLAILSTVANFFYTRFIFFIMFNKFLKLKSYKEQKINSNTMISSLVILPIPFMTIFF